VSKSKKKIPGLALADFEAGMTLLFSHPAFVHLRSGSICRAPQCPHAPARGYCVVDSNGTVHVSRSKRATPEQWAWAIAHAELHLGFGHVPADESADRPQPDAVEIAARCAVVNRFLAAMRVGEPLPPELVETSGADEDVLIDRWRRLGVPPAFADQELTGTAGPQSDQVLRAYTSSWRTADGKLPDWRARFARSLSRAATAAVEVAGGSRESMRHGAPRKKAWDSALSWFVSSYPLLGGIASGLKIVSDLDTAQAHQIWIAAVDAGAGVIYVNPLAALTPEEWRFVLAHEMLHAALRHGDRVGGRDRFLWNVAADYVINGWLLEMAIGTMPDGCLYDAELAGLSAEEVYDRIARDLRRIRKLRTLRGAGVGDVLHEPLPGAGDRSGASDLDDFYRRALLTGFSYHQEGDRGWLPAGLTQEIRTLEHPPPKWDAQLARWFDEYLPRVEPTRGYARPSRRQSSTPDIARPGRHQPTELVPRVTFGVVLDTSASMDVRQLGKALGAVASFATARDVPAVRVVYCDAAPKDAGYVPVEEIGHRLRVWGRGGTELQPGIRLLEKADDFPPDAPILIITDGACDVLTVRRQHAYLVPAGFSLPFKPHGPVFGFR
jgi:predicted metal-dependent peptidase